MSSGNRRKTLVWMATAAAAIALAPGQSAAAAKDPIEVGMAVALTGYLANYDGQFIDGVKLGAERANAAGGIDGHKIDLHILDDASNATTGVTATNQLLNQYQCQRHVEWAVVGAEQRRSSRSSARAKVPQIVVLGSADRSEMGVPRQPAEREAPTRSKLDFANQSLHAQEDRARLFPDALRAERREIHGRAGEAAGPRRSFIRRRSSPPSPT